MSDTRYLVKHGNLWQAVVTVPQDLRILAGQIYGDGKKPLWRFKRSLKTSSLVEANTRKHSVIGEFKARLELLQRAKKEPLETIKLEAQEARKASLEFTGRIEGREESSRDIAANIDDYLGDDVEHKHGTEGRSVFHKELHKTGTAISDKYLEWANIQQCVEQTRVQHKAAVKRYLEFAGQSQTFEETTRKEAGKYVSELLKNSGLSRTTIKRHISSLIGLWSWAGSMGILDDVETNPWRLHKLGKKPKGAYRKALQDHQILSLLRGCYSTNHFKLLLSDALRIALVTGMRLDEICTLTKADVLKLEDDGYWFVINSGKTEAAARQVPVHSVIDGLVERRLKGISQSLFPGLALGGPDKKPSWYVSKAYSRFRKQESVGVSGKGEDFHALRNTFIAVMEGAEVPESTVKLIVGHERNSMTFGHYSKGERVKLRRFINMLDYSDEIMEAIRLNPCVQSS